MTRNTSVRRHFCGVLAHSGVSPVSPHERKDRYWQVIVDPEESGSYADRMSFEVEVKYRAIDHHHVGLQLLEMGAVAGETVDQEDTYLSHPARDLAVTN